MFDAAFILFWNDGDAWLGGWRETTKKHFLPPGFVVYFFLSDFLIKMLWVYTYLCLLTFRNSCNFSLIQIYSRLYVKDDDDANNVASKCIIVYMILKFVRSYVFITLTERQ